MNVAAPGLLAPIVVHVVAPCPPARAFDYFTRDIAKWWPLSTHSRAMADAVDVAFEPHIGGRLVERARDGSEHVWGTVTAWEPGRRVTFTWHPGRDPSTAQSIDVAFALHADGTRVTLTHGGWERHDDGATVRPRYVTGWGIVFGQRYPEFCATR